MKEKPDALMGAYERAAQRDDVDPRCIPKTLDGPPPIGDDIVIPKYPDIDHENWKFLYERQMDMLPGRASKEYMNGVEILGMTSDRIPALKELSAALENVTGWRVARIPGLLHEKDFFNLLTNRIFPSTDYIRGTEELDYTPAPDCFHDIFGHMPMLTNPSFADFYQDFGKAALDAKGQDRISLERLHWFTVEFGLINEPEGLRIFGAGVLSSKNEVAHALGDEVKRVPFDPEKIITQDYDVWRLQDILFVHESFEQLMAGFRTWCKESGLL